MSKEPKANGRPSLYKEEYCQGVISHMSEGYTFESYAGVIGVNRDTLYHWRHEYPSFSDAVKAARQMQLRANEKMMRDIAMGRIRNANATAAIFIMKNCHPDIWRDRREVEIRDPAAMSLADLLAENKRLIAQLEDSATQDD